MLIAPTVADLQQACRAQLVRGNPEWLQRESMGLLIAAMSLPNVLEAVAREHHGDGAGRPVGHAARSDPGAPVGHLPQPLGDRADRRLQPTGPGVAADRRHPAGPARAADLEWDVRNSVRACRCPGSAHRRLPRKQETALRVFAESVDEHRLAAAIDVADSKVVTPLMFQYRLIERARADRRHVVLPEGDDERILRATEILLRLGVVELTLLGDEGTIRAKASAIGVDVTGATILSPNDPELVAVFAKEYTRLRAHKGMTPDLAADIVADVSYFGTMMVHLGMADGMVSGAVHTTAHTIRPSFEIIKTAPGTKIVSSVFLMCLSDRVLVYGDCAVNPDPTAPQLADIAISSAGTAAQFGVDPRVALLSYSTGTSGSGADVEKVRTATDIVHELRPDLLAEGPIQYDAAVDPLVASTKLPGSQVAGRATVLIFPDLNTGNNTYKAVQRSANAVAIGPILQGLNKPVNDLSRGALVADIVNTVAITAVQAQGAVQRRVVPLRRRVLLRRRPAGASPPSRPSSRGNQSRRRKTHADGAFRPGDQLRFLVDEIPADRPRSRRSSRVRVDRTDRPRGCRDAQVRRRHADFRRSHPRPRQRAADHAAIVRRIREAAGGGRIGRRRAPGGTRRIGLRRPGGRR